MDPSGLRNLQFLDRDIIDFSSSGFSDGLGVIKREKVEGVLSGRVSPASSNICVLPSLRTVPLGSLVILCGTEVEPVVNVGSHTRVKDDVHDKGSLCLGGQQ